MNLLFHPMHIFKVIRDFNHATAEKHAPAILLFQIKGFEFEGLLIGSNIRGANEQASYQRVDGHRSSWTLLMLKESSVGCRMSDRNRIFDGEETDRVEARTITTVSNGASCEMLTPVDVKKMMEAGVNIFRLRVANTTHASKLRLLKMIDEAEDFMREKYKIEHRLTATCFTLRTYITLTGFLKEPTEQVYIAAGSTVELTNDNNFRNKCDASRIYTDYQLTDRYIKVGMEITIRLLDEITMICEKYLKDGAIICKVTHGGYLKSMSYLTVKGSTNLLPLLTESDMEIINFVKEFNEADGIVFDREFLYREVKSECVLRLAEIQKFVTGLCLKNSMNWIVKIKSDRGKWNHRRTDILGTATSYYKKLYESNKTEKEIDLANTISIPSIFESEVKKAIDTKSIDKTPSSDGINNEILKQGKEILTPVLTNMFNDNIDTEIIPQQWTESNIILLYKKGDKHAIGNYRPISLMSNIYKVFAKIILKRIERTLDEQQPIEQAGFRKNYSVIDYIRTVRQIIGKNVYNHSTGRIQLEKKGLPFKVGKGVRQGDPLSPKLFSAVLESIVRRLKWKELGINVDGTLLTHLRFADDIVLFVKIPEGITKMIEDLAIESERVGLKLNPEKTQGKEKGKEADHRKDGMMTLEKWQMGKPFYLSGEVMISTLTTGILRAYDVADVSNALLDGATGFLLRDYRDVDCVVRTLRSLNSICLTVEKFSTQKKDIWRLYDEFALPVNAAEACVLACTLSAIQVNAKVIALPTVSGNTLKSLIRLRPACLLVTISSDPDVAMFLHLYRGVLPLIYKDVEKKDFYEAMDSRILYAINYAVSKGVLVYGDNYVTLQRGSPTSPYCDCVRVWTVTITKKAIVEYPVSTQEADSAQMTPLGVASVHGRLRPSTL
ncbi:LINE-1 retrotransposable element ORF2 protein [Eumeta japonica]|uniref:LINE-1 retrotransposable element ORF2 protein n=1 Tax=Eumeta variegata TaxID=151549 RepID=A0A4C1X201_EUMVA|nr:LINE-1 retrotransposable element ORF2 protein [Eumeta japonica]